jgi:DNA-binding response OmpR family regulator
MRIRSGATMSARASVLVVDDQVEILDLASLVLSRAGYDVRTASSGDEALRTLAGAPADIVLMDIDMPGMDGWEALRLIRADDALTTLPVVMFSVKSEIRDKVQSLQAGASGYITKPFDVDELVVRVARYLDEAGTGGVR